MVRDGLDGEDIFILRRCLRMIERLDKEIREVDGRIAILMGCRKEDTERARRAINGEDYAEEGFVKLHMLRFRARAGSSSTPKVRTSRAKHSLGNSKRYNRVSHTKTRT